MHNYSHFVKLVKSTFQSNFTDLCNQVPVGAASPLLPTVAPYLDCDFQTNRLILHAEEILYDDVYTALSNVNSVKIYLNERLYDLFDEIA